MREQDVTGEFTSPGGFVFGVQGWNWGEQRPTSITFFLNGTAKVSDQHGRPIKGTVKDGKPVYFERSTHEQVVEALAEEKIDWTTLVCAGWPQLSYEQLKRLKSVPHWPFNEEHTPASTVGQPCTCIVCSIRNPDHRKAALRIRHEAETMLEKEKMAVEVEAAGK